MKDYSKVKVNKTPHGSGPFSAEDMKRGYKKGSPVTEKDLCDAYQPPHDEYGAVTNDPASDGGRNVGSDYE